MLKNLRQFALGVGALASAGCVSALSVPNSEKANLIDTPSCNEACLLSIAGDYMDALGFNYPEGAPVSENFRMTENGTDISLSDGIWAQAKAWSYRHTFVDQTSGGIGVFGVIRKHDGEDALVALRLKVEAEKITESENLVIHEGDFPLFNPNIVRPREAFYRYVPEERRATREELIDIADKYFDALATGDPSALNFHPDCDRQENGFDTTNNPPRMVRSCQDLYPFVYMHSYRPADFPVIDSERGLVLGVTAFDMPEQEKTIIIRGKEFNITPERQRLPRTLFLYELFKVDDGQVIAIDAFLMNFEYGKKMGWGDR